MPSEHSTLADIMSVCLLQVLRMFASLACAQLWLSLCDVMSFKTQFVAIMGKKVRLLRSSALVSVPEFDTAVA